MYHEQTAKATTVTDHEWGFVLLSTKRAVGVATNLLVCLKDLNDTWRKDLAK